MSKSVPVDEGSPIFLRAGEGERIGTSVLKADRPELSLLEFEVAPGVEIPPHLHRAHSDSFYVLHGELELRIGDETVGADAGSYVLVPPGTVHSIRNAGAEPVRFLNLHTRGGFASYVRELVALQGRGEEPDEAFLARHDVFPAA